MRHASAARRGAERLSAFYAGDEIACLKRKTASGFLTMPMQGRQGIQLYLKESYQIGVTFFISSERPCCCEALKYLDFYEIKSRPAGSHCGRSRIYGGCNKVGTLQEVRGTPRHIMENLWDPWQAGILNIACAACGFRVIRIRHRITSTAEIA